MSGKDLSQKMTRAPSLSSTIPFAVSSFTCTHTHKHTHNIPQLVSFFTCTHSHAHAHIHIHTQDAFGRQFPRVCACVMRWGGGRNIPFHTCIYCVHMWVSLSRVLRTSVGEPLASTGARAGCRSRCGCTTRDYCVQGYLYTQPQLAHDQQANDT